MNRELGPEEKLQIEREFVARQETIARRRSLARKVWVFGVLAGLGFGAIRGLYLHFHTLAYPFLGIVWAFCNTLYIGILSMPPVKDIDLSWNTHLWRIMPKFILLPASPLFTLILFRLLLLH